MDTVIDHRIISSFKEFLSYKLFEEINGFGNKTVSLTKYTPPRNLIGKDVYGSPYAQWIYDDSVSNAQIPSGVGALNRGQSGLSVDFKNGRVIVNSGVPISGSINVSVPDFNFYITTTSIQKILLEKKFEYQPDMQPANQPIRPDSVIAPCIFISYDNTNNKTWALGGVEQSNFNVQVAVLGDNIHKLLGVQKILRDIAHKIFPIVPFTPLNELNDLKTGYWNYEMILAHSTSPTTFVYIDKTHFKILDLDFINQEHPSLLVGLGNVSLSRYSNIDSPDIIDHPTIYQDENELIFYTFNDDSLSEYDS